MKRLAIYCGSATPADPHFIESARFVGRTLAERGIGVVYGGGRLGLMGAVADAALAAGGEVIGVIPRALVDAEVAHRGLTALRVVETMHERKQAFTDLSDGFVTLPGGTGTMDELWEALSWAQLGYHAKPVGLLNVAGFYDGLLAFVGTMETAGFPPSAASRHPDRQRRPRRPARADDDAAAADDDHADEGQRALSDRAALVTAARESIARGSKSFAMASKLFDPATRERAWLLYAWCRACDDLADGQEHGHGMTAVADAPARIATIRALTARALAGEATGEAAFDALGVVAAECAIPHALPFDVIEGFALDAEGWRPQSEDDLYLYCYHVAGAVGVMMALVMGVAPDARDTLDRACDLGLAFQLANIARDVGEDAAAGRCYLPRDWLDAEGIAPKAIMAPANRTGLARLARRLGKRAAAYEASARVGAAALPGRSAWAVLAAAGIYGGIARAVAARGERAWDDRVVTSKAAKLGWVARAGAQAMARGGASALPRPIELWTRPR